tara:strand:+ start:974 stop:1258 length:285 start_codon:yes stop_codon:yes gene_type:complete
MIYDIKTIELNMTNKIKKIKKNNKELIYFYKVSISKCNKNNNYLIYFKNKVPYTDNDIYIGYINFIDNKFKLIKNNYSNIINSYILTIIKNNLL